MIRIESLYCPSGHLTESLAYSEDVSGEESVQQLLSEMRDSDTIECVECGVSVLVDGWSYQHRSIPYTSIDELQAVCVSMADSCAGSEC